MYTVLINNWLIVGRGEVIVQATIHMLVCASDSVIPFALIQVDLRVLVWTTLRQSRWCPEGYPASHFLRAPHC
jgi:hypothetical protein